ncbi:efflux RND transporter periplasmic adaptor subunit [Desulfovibrio inopinatus]|uniref:efflux RND transporter periplasmic adaptor subunit n=1 Tax=Desulfovibrio inopinatus TaxID=102109 RepID=UPI00040A9579|nr:HlyD family secretion protein [Desulfovibrio inopinatus]
MHVSASWRRFLFFIPVIVAIAVFIVLFSRRQQPEEHSLEERSIPVRVVRANTVDLVPRAIGYGSIEPEMTWEAVAELEGRIVGIHPELKRGALISKGDLIVRIDPSKRITAGEQSQAEVKRLLVELDDIEQREKNTRAKLAVEERALDIARVELERRRKLAAKKVISASELDLEEKTWLSQKNSVQELRNQLALLPTNRKQVQAELTKAYSLVTDKQLDLEKTEIRAPFDARVRSSDVELGQAVNPGEVLALLDSIGVAEVLAEFPINIFRRTIPVGANPLSKGFEKVVMRVFQDTHALVTFEMGDRHVAWNGRVVRISDEINPSARTLGVYVAVENPYKGAKPGIRPPLIRNMFCKVELRGAPRPGSLVIPRSAVRQGVVNVVTPENRLERRTVTIDFTMDDLVVIGSGIEVGDQVIISDLPYAIDGMRVDPVFDESAQQRMLDQAEGRGAEAQEEPS